MENTRSLRMRKERGWRMGFDNLFHEANDSWWHTKKWVIQTAFWLLFLNGMFAMFLWKTPEEELSKAVSGFEGLNSMEAVQQDSTASALVVFLVYSGMALPIAAIIFAQDALIGERQSGTVAWVLSKPVSRPAFIFSKLASSTIGLFVTGTVIQGAAAYIQLSLKIGSPWPVPGFLGAMGLMFLNCLFYLTLTYMLGSIFNSRGPVLGISLGMALIGPALLRSLPVCKDFTPWALFFPISEGLPAGLALALGKAPASVTPIICTAVTCLVFTAVTVWRFQREEF